MARRRVNMLEDNEELSNENLEQSINQDNEDEHVSTENSEMNNLSNDENKDDKKEPVDDIKIETVTLKPGDKVKVQDEVTSDTLGRRIHPGIHNYTYTIRSIRPDGIACIECLTHVFNVRLEDLIIL